MKTALYSLILLCLLISGLVHGNYIDSSKLPEKLPAMFVKPLLKAVNSGDVELIESFIKDNYSQVLLASKPVQAHIDYLLNIYNIQGNLSFHSSRDYERYPLPDNELHVVFKTANRDFWYGAIVLANKESQGGNQNNNPKLTRLKFIPARSPSNLAQPESISMEDALHSLDRYVTLMAKMDLFSGVVLLAKREKVLYTAAHGEASKRFGVLNNMQTKFNLGSLTKMFTSVAIMQLVDAGKIRLTDKLNQYMDDSWLAKSMRDKIEIRHLLTHSSGLGGQFNGKIREFPKTRFRSLQDYKAIIKQEKLHFEPGTGKSYSNAGMFLLGVVIENVSGQDYFSFIESNIYQPVGMKDTGSFAMDLPVPNLAIGYHPDHKAETGWRNNLYEHVLKGNPAGGGFSTVADLHRFALALTKYKLLSKSLTEDIYSAKPELRSPTYGYGFSVNETPKDIIVGHEGGFRGINANLDIYLQRGYVAVVMSNYTDGAVYIKRKLRELLQLVE